MERHGGRGVGVGEGGLGGARETQRDKSGGGGERENSNSKSLILKDSSVRSIWTYLTAGPCYTTNTNMHDYTTKRYYKYE